MMHHGIASDAIGVGAPPFWTGKEGGEFSLHRGIIAGGQGTGRERRQSQEPRAGEGIVP